MKSRWYALLLLAWTGLGCVWLPTSQEEPKPAPPPAKPAPARPKRPTTQVTPEQVNEGNAHDMGNRLWDELDRDSQTEEEKAGEKQ